MKKFIIANLKMNFTQEETKKYLIELLPKIENSPNKVAICFPFTSLSIAKDMLLGSKVILGAQNVHQEEEGAFTGEISAKMLKELSCGLVLVGHSERRQYFGESNASVNAKIKRLLKYGIKSVVCIGETKKERTEGKTKLIIKQQLEKALSGLYENELKNIVIAYEPVWSIGTGDTPTSKEIEEVALYIREVIKNNFSEKASKAMTILYGGSVKAENAKTFLSIPEINGGLIGGTSLNAELFAKIANL